MPTVNEQIQLIINRVKNQEVYNFMLENGLINPNELYFVEGDSGYIHPTHTPHSSGLYKITVDELGHVSGVAAVTKEDITALGIPSEDTNTTYSVATTSADGLMSAEDKTKLDSVSIEPEFLTSYSSTSSSDSDSWVDMAAGNGILVTLAESGGTRRIDLYGSSGNYVHDLGNSYTWTSIAFGNGVFVSVSASTQYAYSYDAKSWTEAELPVSQSWFKVVFTGTMFVVAARDSNVVYYSKTGTSWTASSVVDSSASNNVSNLYTIGGAAYIDCGGNIYKTTDCSTFTSLRTGDAIANFTQIICVKSGASIIGMAMTAGGARYYTDNGYTWSMRTTTGLTGFISSALGYVNGLWVLCNANGSSFRVSIDRSTWYTLDSFSLTSSGTYKVLYAYRGILYTVGYDGKIRHNITIKYAHNGVAIPIVENEKECYSVALLKTGWSSSAPYTQQVYISGLDGDADIVVGSVYDSETYESLQDSQILCTSQETNYLTFTALGNKPTVNFVFNIGVL